MNRKIYKDKGAHDFIEISPDRCARLNSDGSINTEPASDRISMYVRRGILTFHRWETYVIEEQLELTDI